MSKLLLILTLFILTGCSTTPVNNCVKPTVLNNIPTSCSSPYQNCSSPIYFELDCNVYSF